MSALIYNISDTKGQKCSKKQRWSITLWKTIYKNKCFIQFDNRNFSNLIVWGLRWAVIWSWNWRPVIELIKIARYTFCGLSCWQEVGLWIDFSFWNKKKPPYFALVVVGHLILIIWKAWINRAKRLLTVPWETLVGAPPLTAGTLAAFRMEKHILA